MIAITRCNYYASLSSVHRVINFAPARRSDVLCAVAKCLIFTAKIGFSIDCVVVRKSRFERKSGCFYLGLCYHFCFANLSKMTQIMNKVLNPKITCSFEKWIDGRQQGKWRRDPWAIYIFHDRWKSLVLPLLFGSIGSFRIHSTEIQMKSILLHLSFRNTTVCDIHSIPRRTGDNAYSNAQFTVDVVVVYVHLIIEHCRSWTSSSSSPIFIVHLVFFCRQETRLRPPSLSH